MEGTSPKVAMAADAPTDPRMLCPAFVGRLREIEAFDRVLAEVLDGRGRAMLVSGDAGMGKSALLRSLVDRAARADTRVLLGECLSIESARPFGPFVDIFRSALRTFGKDAEQIVDERAIELLRLLPERRRKSPPGELLRDDWHRLHVSFAVFLEALGRREPLVIAVDDLQWADEATLELLPYLVRKLRNVPVLVLATLRTPDEGTAPGLLPAIAELERTRALEELRLGPLALAESGELVRLALHLRRHVPPELRRLLHDQSEGNPFYLEELLKELVERRDLTYEDGSWGLAASSIAAVPSSVRATTEQRLARLTEETRRALRIAAVIGPRVELTLLGRIAGLDSAGLSDVVRHGLGAQLLSDAPAVDGSYSFRHALTREAILGTLPRTERAELHRAVAVGLEGANLATRDSEELAYHYEGAGNRTNALRYHLLAADDAAAILARGREARHLERAIELAPPEVPKGRLYLRLDSVLNDVTLQPTIPTGFSRDESARRQVLTAALRSFEEEGDRAGIGRVLVELAHTDLSSGANPHDVYARGLTLLESYGPSEDLCRARHSIADNLTARGRPVEAIEYSRLAVETAQDVGDTSAEALALSQLGQLLGIGGRVDEAVMHGRRALELALKEDAPDIVERCYYGLEQVLYDQPVEERRCHDEHVAYARRHGLHELPFITWGMLTWAFDDRDWDTALTLLADLPPDNPWDHYAQTTYGSRIAAARSGPRDGLAIIEEHGGTFPDIAALCGAMIKLLADDSVGTLATLERYDVERDAFRLFPKLVLALVASARLEDGSFDAWRAHPLTGLTGLNADICKELADGLHEARSGSPTVASAHLMRCLEMFGKSRRRLLLEHFVRCELLRVRVAAGHATDLAQARSELAAMITFWEKAKATWLIGQLRRSARTFGLNARLVSNRAARPGRAGRSRLTRREREVASLVAEGLTNRQIAERLVIAERTAEGHVEQIRGKLGFRARTQIAAWVAEHLVSRIT